MRANTEYRTKGKSFLARANSMVAWFIMSGSIILLVVGLAKVVGSFGHDGILDQDDSVFQVPLRYLTRWVGSLEILISIICLWLRKHGISAALLAFMSTDFAIYRVGMLYTGPQRMCPCLGSLTGLLHLPRPLADRIAVALFVYLVIGSYLALFWLWRTKALFCTTGRSSIAAPTKVI